MKPISITTQSTMTNGLHCAGGTHTKPLLRGQLKNGLGECLLLANSPHTRALLPQPRGAHRKDPPSGFCRCSVVLALSLADPASAPFKVAAEMGRGEPLPVGAEPRHVSWIPEAPYLKTFHASTSRTPS